MTISTPHAEINGTVSRVAAEVDGVPLWFESSDAPLVPSMEAFASALLLPSKHHRRVMKLEAPVSDTWKRNVTELLPIWQRWWTYDATAPLCQTRADREPLQKGTALLFSGGVDSFHSLLNGPRPNFLVSVHGFDIRLDDAARMARLDDALREAAEALGCKPIVIRTNLRSHPAVGRPHLWERGHGGGLTAVGHLLSDRIDRLIISSSYSLAGERPWGSTSQTDSLFAADGFSIEHYGGKSRREEKVGAIASHPLVRKHLRVCWENRLHSPNCSRCEKCVIAMIHLSEQGLLEEFKGFDSTPSLADRIDSLPLLIHDMNLARRVMSRGFLDPQTSKSLDALIHRSERAAPLLSFKSRIRSGMDRLG